MNISEIAKSLSPSTTLEITALFNDMKNQGLDVLSFGAGEPDFHTSNHIKDAVIEALQVNFTKYTNVAGDLKLREAICNRLKADLNIEYAPSEVVVTSGAKHMIYTVLMCLVNPLDEVIIPAPFWVSYYEMIKQSGATPKCVLTKVENDFKITPAEILATISDKTKVIILNNPSNPTGSLYSKEELYEICSLCAKKNIYIIADEIYYKLIYDDLKFTSVALLGDEIKSKTILIHGVSKSYCMTGFRIGYALCDEKLAKIFSNYLSHSMSNACSVSQYASIVALNSDQEYINQMVLEFEKRRNLIVEKINSINNISCKNPSGAFYIMINLSEIIGKKFREINIENDVIFSKLLLKHYLVAVVPCKDFGISNYVRLSFCTSADNIENGISRLKEFLGEIYD